MQGTRRSADNQSAQPEPPGREKLNAAMLAFATRYQPIGSEHHRKAVVRLTRTPGAREGTSVRGASQRRSRAEARQHSGKKPSHGRRKEEREPTPRRRGRDTGEREQHPHPSPHTRTQQRSREKQEKRGLEVRGPKARKPFSPERNGNQPRPRITAGPAGKGNE